MRSPLFLRSSLVVSLAALSAACSSGSGGTLNLTSTAPASGATGVALAGTVTAIFDKALDPSSVTASTLSLSPAVSGASVATSGAVATLTHASPFAPGTTYTVMLSSSIADTSGDTLGSDQSFSFTTVSAGDTTAPAQITTLAASAPTTTTIALSWTAVGNDGTTGTATVYKLRYTAGPSCPLTSNNFSTATPVTTGAPKAAGAAETASATGLQPGTTYCFGIEAGDAAGNFSPLSNIATAMTAGLPDTTPPAAVIDLAAVAASDSAIALTWTAPGNDGSTGTATSYDLRYSITACPITDATFSAATAITTSAPQAAGSAETASATGLSPSTAYCFALKTSDGAGNVSAISNNATASTPAAPQGAISDLSATAAGEMVSLAWTAPAHPDAAATYDIYYSAGSCPADPTTFAAAATGHIGSVAAGPSGAAETHAVTGLLPSTLYCFGITLTDVTASPMSNLVATATGDDIPPGTVAAITAGAVDAFTVALSWIAPGDNGATGTVASYDLRYQAQLAGATDCSAFSYATATPFALAPPFAAGGTTESRTVTGLAASAPYCFAFTATDAAGNVSAVSAAAFAVTAVSIDHTAPTVMTLALTAGSVTDHGAVLTSVAPNPNDADPNAAAFSYDLRYLAGVDCSSPTLDFSTGVAVPVAAPMAPGGVETFTLANLPAASAFCVAIASTDAAGNESGFSNVVEVDTSADTTPPGAASDLMIVSYNDADTVRLSFTMTGDDGSTGQAAEVDVFRSFGALCPITPANFSMAQPTTMDTGPGAPGTTQFEQVPEVDGDVFCFAVVIKDAAGNVSALSNSPVYVKNGPTPPGAPATSAVAATSLTFTWTAGSGDGTSPSTGVPQATSYVAGYTAAADCSAFALAGAQPISALPVPAASGTAQSVIITGLMPATSYCIGVAGMDAFGNRSDVATIAVTTPVAPAISSIAAVRSLVAAAAATPISFSPPQEIDGAVVSYVKISVGAIPDGNGFFLQDAAAGTAIYVALDPASFLSSGAVAAGDTLNIIATQGAWLDCSSCTAANSMYVITAATGTRTGTGASLPAALPLATTNVLIPASPAAWADENLLVSGTVTLPTTATFASSGAGYHEANVTTGGDTTTTSSTLTLRLPDTLLASTGVIAGCTVALNPVPLWRFGAKAEISAWSSADIASVTACPTPTVSLVPDNAAAGGGTFDGGVADGGLEDAGVLAGAVPFLTTTSVALTFSQPMQAASLPAQATAGSCSGRVQLSTDPNFAGSCVGLTVSPTGSAGTQFIATPTAALAADTTYYAQVAPGATSVNGAQTTSPALARFATNDQTCTASPLVISQVYGGGGNSGATYTNDFVELYNRSAADVVIDPASLSTTWAIQYGSSSIGAAASWSGYLAIPATTIAAGHYFLIQLAGGAVGAALPVAADFSNAGINLSGTDGKVALTLGTTTKLVGCTFTNVQDLVIFGTGNSTCNTTYGTTPSLSSTTAAIRVDDGCQDTDVMPADFSVALPAPRNSSTAAVAGCSCPSLTPN